MNYFEALRIRSDDRTNGFFIVKAEDEKTAQRIADKCIEIEEREEPNGIPTYEVQLREVDPDNNSWAKGWVKDAAIGDEVFARGAIALDTETTGFLPDDEVLQLSIVDGTGKKLFNQYFKPNHKTSWESAMAVNHITPDMVAKENPIQMHKKDIEEILDKAKVIVGYNLGFDMTMLAQNGIRLPEERKYVDLMGPFAEVYGQHKEDGTIKWQKLTTCAKHYGFKQDGTWHDSMGDTNATMYCYKKMRENDHIQEKDKKDLDYLLNFKRPPLQKQIQEPKQSSVTVVKHKRLSKGAER